MTLDVLTIGVSTIDLIATVGEFPRPDDRMPMRAFTRCVGGVAAVAGVALARLGARVGYAGTVGDDDEGRQIRAQLDEDGVDTSLLAVDATVRTPTTIIISDEAAGTRSILNAPSVATFGLPARAEVAAAARRARYVHLDHTAFPALADIVLPACRDTGTLVSLDAGVDFPEIVSYLPLIDIYATTDRQLAKMTGTADLAEGLRWVREAGPRVVVATRGALGSVALADDGSVIAAGAFNVPVVDTTGAGDVFHGALLYALLRGQRLDEALVFANAAAALSCCSIGGRPGCPSLHQVNVLLGSARVAVERYQE